MGNALSQYNPFSVYGSYNLKKQAYENKRGTISILTFILLIVVGGMVMVWVTGDTVTSVPKTYNLPPPKFGIGPYGYGLYIPPAGIISASVANS